MMEQLLLSTPPPPHAIRAADQVKVTEITYMNGVRLENLIAKNGEPLPPEDDEKETERVDKAIAKAKERVAAAQAKGEETDSNGDTLISLDRLLQIFTHQQSAARDAERPQRHRFDFAGNHSVKTKGIPEGVMQSISGPIWIDEKDTRSRR